MSKKKYKLLKDLPGTKAGQISPVHKQECKKDWLQFLDSDGNPIIIHNTNGKFDSEWFEEVIELPKTWEELNVKSGWVINNGRPVYVENTGCYDVCTSHMYATKAQAKSAIAFAKLSQLVKSVNDFYYSNWRQYDSRSIHTVSRNEKNELITDEWFYTYFLLAFPTNELAQASLENNRDLWEDYWMISKQED